MSILTIAKNVHPVLVIVLVIVGLGLGTIRRHRNNRSQSIPGPKGLTGLGISLPFRSQDVMRRWALEYGELFQIRVGWYNWVVINSPEAMKEIFDKQVSV